MRGKSLQAARHLLFSDRSSSLDVKKGNTTLSFFWKTKYFSSLTIDLCASFSKLNPPAKMSLNLFRISLCRAISVDKIHLTTEKQQQQREQFSPTAKHEIFQFMTHFRPSTWNENKIVLIWNNPKSNCNQETGDWEVTYKNPLLTLSFLHGMS